MKAVAVTLSIACPEGTVQGGGDQDRALGVLAAFRRELYRCFSKRPDGLAELADAVLCKPDRVHMLAELSLVAECRRGHGAVYDAVNSGRVQMGRLRRSLAALPFPAWADGRIRLAADVSNWLRPDAQTSPDRLFCHTYARGKGNAQMIPGWPYSVVAALEPGRTSWTLPLDAVRLGPADDATEVTAAQLRQVAERIIAAGHWRDGDPDILVVFDAGYDLTRLAWLLRDLPVEVLGRLRSDRVMYFPAPPRQPGTSGRPIRHGAAFKLADPATWPARRQPPSPRRPGTAPRGPRPGDGCTSSWPPGPDGKASTASCPSSRAPSSGCRSSTCPATAAPTRCGYGPPAPGPPPIRWTAPGRRSCAGLISNTRSFYQPGLNLSCDVA